MTSRPAAKSPKPKSPKPKSPKLSRDVIINAALTFLDR